MDTCIQMSIRHVFLQDINNLVEKNKWIRPVFSVICLQPSRTVYMNNWSIVLYYAKLNDEKYAPNRR